MAFLDKLSNAARNIGDKTSGAIETSKLNSKISAEKTAIDECMRKLGEHYYTKHQAGEKLGDGAAAICADIDGHNKTIADTQEEIAHIKAENVVKAQARAQASEARANEAAASKAAATSAAASDGAPALESLPDDQAPPQEDSAEGADTTDNDLNDKEKNNG